ncbi:TonB-dependent siderophore myxochelin receptor MxcH [Sorangium sp. So ce367]|uniref:TonB-dependent siderophore myxochelin receptor MxcH n=1 Tax=Sorangium sp. So ce367 TaxID=3133305 RepID=UPI003F6032EC
MKRARKDWSTLGGALLFAVTPAAFAQEAPAPAAEGQGAPVAEAPVADAQAAPVAEAQAAPAIEVMVKGDSEADRLRQSAEPVEAFDTDRAQRESADLGEVLGRKAGVSARRSGGLGSQTRFSLNGLVDDQIRFFVDGVPLEFSGFGQGIANIPVNLVERVEIYRGVVPTRFGADALGGVVNLATDQSYRGTRAAASYEVGSFDTYRLTAMGRRRIEPSGFFVGASGFLDAAKNDYAMDAPVADRQSGRPRTARVHRFNDAYRAIGGNLELGFVDQPWAKRLLLRLFATDYAKGLQHTLGKVDADGVYPYGEVEYGETVAGGTLRYQRPHWLIRRLSLAALGGYSFRTLRFTDTSRYTYDWFGRRVAERKDDGGEIAAWKSDTRNWEHQIIGRVNASYTPSLQHTLRLSMSPTLVARTGEERRRVNPDSIDPLSARRALFTLVSGLEHQLDVMDRRLENIVFVKDYLYHAASELAGDEELDRTTHGVGFGDALRFRFTDWLWAKASYEYASRLPRPDEIFGNGVLIRPNLELQPDRSHNLNLSATVDARDTRAGAFRGDVSGFLRDTEHMSALLVSQRVYTRYQNISAVRSLGVEAAAGWTAPGEYIAIDGNVTWMDLRNTSEQGDFALFNGSRMPNRPWLFGNASVRLELPDVSTVNDRIALTWTARYAHEFYVAWEDAGDPASKDKVDSQVVHLLALEYMLRAVPSVSATLEVQNLTDAPAFDYFGVPRPGRAVYFKATAEL